MIIEHEQGYYVKILKDSINSTGGRLTTFESCGWRPPHADFMTHREFSRNASSSRAIPVTTFIDQVENTPALPIYWGKNQKGMQAREEITSETKAEALQLILELRDQAVTTAKKLAILGLHKQTTNRYLEPWMFIKVIFSATNYNNYLYLRDTWKGGDPGMAQPEVAWIAKGVAQLLKDHRPRLVHPGEWHLPLVNTEDPADPLYMNREEAANLQAVFEAQPGYVKYSEDYYYDAAIRLSVGRCARGSYMTHDKKRDLIKDVELHDSLLKEMHMSPFEHQASPDPGKSWGNFVGWKQLRKTIPNECVR